MLRCIAKVNRHTPAYAQIAGFCHLNRAGCEARHRLLRTTEPRRGAGVVERGGLENRCTFAGTQGSNPCLSATENP